MTGKIRVLIVAAHPDDEVLGCGGTAARHAANGDEVHILIVAEGATSRTKKGDEWKDKDKGYAGELKALRAAAGKAACILGARPPELAGFSDNRLDTVAFLDVTQRIERTVTKVKPAVVYTHHGGDLNVDHRIVHQAVLTACRPLPGSTVRSVYTFEIVSSTEWASPIDNTFRPTRFVDIADYLKTKLAALGAYEMEIRAFPHARSIANVSALASHRGAGAGLKAAEAFMVIREIVP